jgi:signal transduction histidine kinase
MFDGYKTEKTITKEEDKFPNEQDESKLEKMDKLEKENGELKGKLENMKKLFRIIAHDLKTPVGNTAVFIDLLSKELKDGNMSKEELVEYLDMVSRSSGAAHKLLDDLLKWTRLQQEGMKPEISTLELANQVEDSIAPLIQTAKEKGVDLENEVPKDIDVLADGNMLNAIIRNLSSNAIKFTKGGERISISSMKKGDQVEIYVKDNGVGLNEEQVKKLFDNVGFSNEGTNGEKGTGFGLSICKEMLSLMNGTIRAESEGEGKGTTFIVTLPAGVK